MGRLRREYVRRPATAGREADGARGGKHRVTLDKASDLVIDHGIDRQEIDAVYGNRFDRQYPSAAMANYAL
jgi:hypothetical protein